MSRPRSMSISKAAIHELWVAHSFEREEFSRPRAKRSQAADWSPGAGRRPCRQSLACLPSGSGPSPQSDRSAVAIIAIGAVHAVQDHLKCLGAETFHPFKGAARIVEARGLSRRCRWRHPRAVPELHGRLWSPGPSPFPGHPRRTENKAAPVPGFAAIPWVPAGRLGKRAAAGTTPGIARGPAMPMVATLAGNMRRTCRRFPPPNAACRGPMLPASLRKPFPARIRRDCCWPPRTARRLRAAP